MRASQILTLVSVLSMIAVAAGVPSVRGGREANGARVHASQKSEHVLCGIDVYRTTLPEVIARYGQPDGFEETTNADYPKGSGERAYTWRTGAITLTVSTVFRTDTDARSVIESYVQTVEVLGARASGSLGATGSGLALGDQYADILRIYGSPRGGDPGKYGVEFVDGTYLAIDLGHAGRIVRLHLDTNPE